MKLTGYYTTAGEKIAAGLLAGATLSVTRITAGSGSTALSAAALSQEQQDLGPCQPEVSGTTAVMRCTLSSDQASAPYFLRELGVYALDSAGKETLYLIFRLDEEMSINPAFRLVLRFNLEQTLSDGAGVKITAPLTGLATQEDLKAKADLLDGQVPYDQTPHLIRNTSLYVDAALGDDANPGTEEAPFKTIQAAIDSLPRDLSDHSLTIYVAPGTYSEHVLITGFIGGTAYRPFTIQGADALDGSRTIGSLSISNCATLIRVEGFRITDPVTTTFASLMVSGTAAYLSYMEVKKGDDEKTIGINIGGHAPSQAWIANCSVDGYSDAGIRVDYASMANVAATAVKNCGVGIQASGSAGSAGFVSLYGVTYEGNSTDKSSAYGGQIFGGV